MRYRYFLVPALACLGGGGASGGGEEEDGHPEYLALYSFGVEGGYLVQLGGAGAEAEGEASVEFMVVPASSADHEGLEEAEEASIPGEQQRLPRMPVCLNLHLTTRPEFGSNRLMIEKPSGCGSSPDSGRGGLACKNTQVGCRARECVKTELFFPVLYCVSAS